MSFANRQRWAGLIVGGFVAYLFFLTPVSAQTPQEQYRASLINIILALQNQIAELQLQLASPVTDPQGILSDIEGEVVASYQIDQQEISARAPQVYQAYFDRLLTVLPDQYDDYIDELVIFTKGDEAVGAYVETQTPYTKDWRYAVRDSEVLEDPASKASTELMIHEFAHIFSFDQVFEKEDYAATCHSYFIDKICYGAYSYLGQFVETFWSNKMLDQLQLVEADSRLTRADFYEKYKSQFVSDYAATDPAEDFAESFTWYVSGYLAPRGSIADEKIEFFDRFTFTQALADQINQAL